MKESTYDFGLVGLGVMGRNFILNVADNGFSALGNDLDQEKVDALIAEGGDTAKVNATSSVEEFTRGLKQPRKIMMLVPAGKIVDVVIESLLPHLNEGDILIDGGNSYFTDTDRREKYLTEKGIHFFGAGVSGGAKGARIGPSIMPGGSETAYEEVRPIFEAVAANFKGDPCVAYLGPKSAGNYVKMVHNGIEYGLMQLTSEIYSLLKAAGDYTNDELHSLYDQWNQGRLQSFLVEISSKIFLQQEEGDEQRLIDLILDKAKQKGTGKWTSQNAMDLGIPIPTIDVSVSMREISSIKSMRTEAETLYPKSAVEKMDKQQLAEMAEKSLYFSFIITYAQGMHQLAEASEEYGYNLDLSTVARIWRAGCIIRAALLEDIMEAYEDRAISNFLMSPVFIDKLKSTVGSVRDLVSFAAKNGIPLPGISNSLVYFDAFTSGRLPLNLIQAQRDFFGSHTYERLDKEGIFHTEWE